MPIPGLETAEPDGAMPWPLTLVEGEEQSGKTWDVVTFIKQCDRIGEAYWIPLDESGHARMYGGRLPGKPFELVKMKTGDYVEVLDAIRKIKAHAAAQHAAGEKPVCMVIDTISGIWSGLHDWVNARHRETRKAREILRNDPNADVGRAGRNLWNDADTRWRDLVRELKTFPGLVIVTARGKEISATDPDSGQPLVDNQRKPVKTWSIETKKGFEYYVDVHLRKRREEGAFVVGVRSVEHGRKPGSEEAKEAQPILAAEADGRELEWLLFDVLGLDPKTAYVNEFTEFAASDLTDAELEAQHRAQQDGGQGQGQQQRTPPRGRRPLPSQMAKRVAECTDLYELRELWMDFNRIGLLQVEVELPGGVFSVDELITARKEMLEEAARKEEQQARDAEKNAKNAATAPPVDAGEEGQVNALVGEKQPDVPPVTPTAAVAQAMTGSRPRTGKERTPEQVEQEKKGTEADPPDLCRDSPARRGILSSLEGMGITEAEVVEHFGRPMEQIGTRRITTFVQDAVKAKRDRDRNAGGNAA